MNPSLEHLRPATNSTGGPNASVNFIDSGDQWNIRSSEIDIDLVKPITSKKGTELPSYCRPQNINSGIVHPLLIIPDARFWKK
jgi:hypothetical protein